MPAATQNGRLSVANMTTVGHGDMLNAPEVRKGDIQHANPDNNYGLGVAKVVDIDYEEYMVSLQVIMGSASDTVRVPVPLTFPGAGNRHFLGSLPEVGDLCVVGWMPQESRNQQSKTPVILNWIVPGSWLGRNWLTSSSWTTDEADMGDKITRDVVAHMRPRLRHKLRHVHSGMIAASSSMGSDLVLDEGVQLSNRKGNEFLLRDQDQAAVLRALQSFTALAGVRSYTGMVQRDARTLQTQLVSDGKDWTYDTLQLDGEPVPDLDLPASDVPAGKLTPSRAISGSFLNLEGNLDPFTFLTRGGLIDDRGYAVPSGLPSATYNGKPVYRVGTSQDNGFVNPDVPVFTEHRIELTHTSDGRLPVTEQTDMFDADRLPDAGPTVNGGKKQPFFEQVFGTVVGNDPFSEEGQNQYGLPLTANVLSEEGNPFPSIQSAFGLPVEEQLAFLQRLYPLDPSLPYVFSAWNKKGQGRFVFGGPKDEDSIQAFLYGGLNLAINGRTRLAFNGPLEFTSVGPKTAAVLKSEQGPVVISGAKGGTDPDQPSVSIEGGYDVRVRAGRKVLVKGASVETNATSIRMNAHQDMALTTAGRIGVSAERLNIAVLGKKTEDFTGPVNLLPTNGALHERTYTPAYPGLDCETVKYTWGNRVETFNLGNHTTTVQVGNATYETNLGLMTVRGMTAALTLGVAGASLTADVGNATVSASTGSASVTGLTSVDVTSIAGPATVRGATNVYLGAPIVGPDSGPIICAGSIDPLTGLPFATWGMGAKQHVVGS